MNTKEIREYKNTLKLTDIQKSILIGTLLGDGHLETQDNGKTYRLKIEHQLAQQDYTEWLHNHFREWVRNGIYRKVKSQSKEYVGFTTYSHGAFRFYAQQFYIEKKKHIPRMISKLLNPLVVAIWFMDDGSWKSEKHKTFIIHTLGFTKEDLMLVQDSFRKLFNIETALHRQKEKYWRLYIKSSSAKEFEKLIRPYTSPIASMKKKMGNTNA
jgi:hypothetical protein